MTDYRRLTETGRSSALVSFVRDRFFWQPALSALLLGLSRHPLRLNFLIFAAFIPLLALLYKEKNYAGLKIIKLALTFSTVYTLITLYWISVVTLPGFLGMFILFGAYFIILFYFVTRICIKIPRLRFIGFASCWLSFEWLLNFGELRFPWFNAGYSLAEYTPLIQIAEIGGIYLLSLIILIVNLLIFNVFRSFPSSRSKVALIALILLILVWTAGGLYRLKTLPLIEDDFRGAIVQVSIPQDIKWDGDFYDRTLALYREYTLKAAEKEPSLIILPESAIPDYVLQANKPKNFILNLVNDTETYIFLGLPHYELVYENEQYEYKFYNATTLVNPAGFFYRPYYKIYLVPFGERIPFMDYFPVLRKLEFGQANWEYGEEIIHFSVKTDNREYLFSSLICFEIAFPALTAKIAEDEVDFMVNVTNDAWFKRTAGPYQHGMMTVIRGVETRTQIYRAANTGISMIVNPQGRIIADTLLYEKTVIEEPLYLYPGSTIYVRHLRNYPVIFLLTALSLFFTTLIRSFSFRI